jgi:hypothetical protein
VFTAYALANHLYTSLLAGIVHETNFQALKTAEGNVILMNAYRGSISTLSTCGVAVLNGDRSIRYCNDHLLRWIHATPTQCNGKSITTIFPDFPAEISLASSATVNAPKSMLLQSFIGGLEEVIITVRPLDLDGKASLIVVVEHSDSVVEPMPYQMQIYTPVTTHAVAGP